MGLGRPERADDGRGPGAHARASPRSEKAVSNGPTGTNTQEADVDEPDVAKTDGRLVVRVRDGRRLVVTDVTGSEPRQLADWRLPLSAYADSLLLVGDHVLLSSSTNRMMGREGFFPGGPGSTDVYDVDISDPAHPRLADRRTWSGQQVSMRQYGDTVRLVTTIGLPQLRFVAARRRQPQRAPGRATQPRDRAHLADRGLDPGTLLRRRLPPADLVGAGHGGRVDLPTGSTAADASQVGVTGAGSEVYSSTDRLYVTSTDWGSRPILRGGPDTTTRSDQLDRALRPKTYIHAFALDGDSTRYVASGAVNGTIKDGWSLDEQDGHLRVAVSWLTNGLEPKDNGIAVLDEHDGKLEQVGALHGLGIGEQVQSVRWFDDLAVLVTFRQTDPLYTIDLSDPTRPRLLGALKIPGFSSYLHPIGDDRLLGIGSDATETGQQLGAQAAVFDIADTSDVRQVGKVTFGMNSWLEAADDPHAFTWLPDAHAAVTSVQDGSRTSMVLLRVAPDGSLSEHELGSVGGWAPRALPLEDGRVALVGDQVRIVDLTELGGRAASASDRFTSDDRTRRSTPRCRASAVGRRAADACSST